MKRSELNLTMPARQRSAKALYELAHSALLDHLGDDVKKRIGAGRILCTAHDLRRLLDVMVEEKMSWDELMAMVKTERTGRIQKRMF